MLLTKLNVIVQKAISMKQALASNVVANLPANCNRHVTKQGYSIARHVPESQPPFSLNPDPEQNKEAT